MKIRLGFVSNSSSTSFCIYGTIVNTGGGEPKYWELTEKIEKAGLAYHQLYEDSDDLVVGGEPKNCLDNQTMGDFKKEIEEPALRGTGLKNARYCVKLLRNAGYSASVNSSTVPL